MSVTDSDATREIAGQHVAWLVKLSKWANQDPSNIAIQAGLSGTTLTRLLSGTRVGPLKAETVKKLIDRYEVPGPEEYARGALFPGEEAEPFDLKGAPADIARTARALMAERPGVELWELLDRDVLIAAGFLRGDILCVDTTATPRAHDAVRAEAPGLDGRGIMRPIWRVYTPPYLVSAAPDRTRNTPLPVDGERVRITGVVTAMFRPRPLSAIRG